MRERIGYAFALVCAGGFLFIVLGLLGHALFEGDYYP